MDSFHLSLYLSIYKSFLLGYVSIKIENLLSDNCRDGTQRTLFDLQRQQYQEEDRRILRVCEAKREVQRFLRRGDET
ncbi:hypothetical protein Bca52824_073915 [Brassica carinata]|uniref:Uncharacterized protein n=1 Tax=Brassica carinata TaxID=52824 RepID=A0A8X7U772_BRACI|nr:hypothetical protein Bca52824_073915 [Brassica carinata]